MKHPFLKGLSLLVIASIFFHLLSCGSGSEEQNETDSTAFDQEAYKQQVEGVFEIINPVSAQIMIYNGHFLYVGGPSDTTINFEYGTYNISNDTVHAIWENASDSSLIGQNFMWKTKLVNDTIQTTLFKTKGETITEIKSIKLSEINNELAKEQGKFEGILNFHEPAVGKGILINNYYAFFAEREGEKFAHAGTYAIKNDSLTITLNFTLNDAPAGTSYKLGYEESDGESFFVITSKNNEPYERKYTVSRVQ